MTEVASAKLLDAPRGRGSAMKAAGATTTAAAPEAGNRPGTGAATAPRPGRVGVQRRGSRLYVRGLRLRPRTGSRVVGPALLLCSMTSLQFGAALSTSLFSDIGPAGASTLRLGFAALVMLVLARPTGRTWSRRQRLACVLFGATLAGMNGLFYEAISRMPLGAAITVEFLGPLGLAAVLSRRPRDVVWVVAALTGVVLLGLQETHGNAALGLAGILFAAGAGVFWAGYILAGSRVAAEGLGFQGLAAATAIAALITLPTGIAGAGSRLLHPHVLGVGVLIALLASVIPYSCEIAALARLPKRSFSILLALEPAVGALAGAVLLHQHVTAVSGLAIGCVIAAGIGSTLTSDPQAHVQAAEPEATEFEVVEPEAAEPASDGPDALAAEVAQPELAAAPRR